MEEDLDRTIQEELDWGVQQLQTGLFQLKLSPQQALNSTPAASQQHNSIDCVLGAHAPEGMSDDPVETHPACGLLNSNPSDSSKQQQAGSSDIVTAASHQSVEEERLKVFTEAESQESDFKFNFANSKTDGEVQLGNCTGRPVPIVQSMETKDDPVLQSPQKAEQVRHSENTASKPSQKKKKKMRSSKHVAEAVRGGDRRSGESDGKERNSEAHGVGRCLVRKSGQLLGNTKL
ncbi:uncharacterized protein [Heterodontus francisci]|uniref:uncharacterized protein n=1 Tax=Heterodontus francisci TaxID=7792 RepID=UPI00355C2E1A